MQRPTPPLPKAENKGSVVAVILGIAILLVVSGLLLVNGGPDTNTPANPPIHATP